MTTRYDFSRLRRLMTIYAVVQVLLVGLLIYMALNFQTGLQAEGRPQRFFHSIMASFVIQLALFYPINRFAASEAKREIESCATNLTPDDLKSQRSKRMVSDVIKSGVFIFFVAFIYKAPKDRFVLSVIFFTFILTALNYFQNYNFAVKRSMREKG